jgi:hypothetical protein
MAHWSSGVAGDWAAGPERPGLYAVDLSEKDVVQIKVRPPLCAASTFVSLIAVLSVFPRKGTHPHHNWLPLLVCFPRENPAAGALSGPEDS